MSGTERLSPGRRNKRNDECIWRHPQLTQGVRVIGARYLDGQSQDREVLLRESAYLGIEFNPGMV
jgi:hypothetical protein